MLNETHLDHDVNIFNYTCSKPAAFNKLKNPNEMGHANGGITTSSKFPLYKHKT
jgi:hypothetical protein